MRWQENLGVAIASGVLVPAILGGARLAWTRRRVPTAFGRSVRRKSYLGAVLSQSRREEVTTLDVLAPRLAAAGPDETIQQIQLSWERINARGRVRVLTLDSEECLKGGTELADGIEIRIARRDLGSEGLSYHLFGAPSPAAGTVIVNYHQDSTDRPVRLSGTALAQVFRDHFDAAWSAGRPLESILAERIVANAGRLPDAPAILRSLSDIAGDLNLNPKIRERVLTHLALRQRSVVFVVGLPGTGKSMVRRILAHQLRTMGIQTHEVSDYVYAYRDFLHGRIQLQPPRGGGFEPHDGGAFGIQDEGTLKPALQALAQATRESAKEHQVTLVEFARVDLVTALQEFDELRCRSQIIHVKAPRSMRTDRLRRRAEPPEMAVDGQSIRLVLSDDHALPSAIDQDLYRVDGLDRLTASPRWRDRILLIDNDIDDGGARIEKRMQALIHDLVEDYRANADPIAIPNQAVLPHR